MKRYGPALPYAAGLLALAAAWLAAHGYLVNQKTAFYAGLILLATGLAGAAVTARRGKGVLAMVAIAVALFATTLPVAESVLASRADAGATDQTVKPFYSYRQAVADPGAFKLWWEFYLDQRNKSRSEISIRLPAEGGVPHVFKPGAHGRFFLSDIDIDDYGFRGPPFAFDKGDRYRIVALGASTTQGATILPGDKTWPAVLEALIHQRLDCPRPVEVLNAGIEGYDVGDNLVRLERKVLPLKPDMVISFQTYMGFSVGAYDFFPRGPLRIVSPKVLPPLPERPSRLLAALEHRIRLAVLEYRLPVDKDATYRAIYERMIATAHRAGIKLVMATHPHAVNAGSPPEVIDFYTQAFPDARKRIAANLENTTLVQALGREHPEVAVIDTRAGLDGAYNGKYLDLVHFSQWGRNVLAWNLFTGLVPLLKEAPGCVPVKGALAVPASVTVDPWTAADLAQLTQWLERQRLDFGDLSLDRLGPENATGIAYVEGPYPQWHIPHRFRWMIAPSASVAFHVGAKGTAAGTALNWRMSSHALPQNVQLRLDGVPIASQTWNEAGTWPALTATLPAMTPGRHVLTVSAERFVQYPGDGRKLYVMLGPLDIAGGHGTGGTQESRPIQGGDTMDGGTKDSR